MPAPKRRHSRARGRKRRTHYVVKAPSKSECPNCGAFRLPHRVCPECGYYNEKPVVSIREKSSSKAA